MALVQSQQFTASGLGNAPRPLLFSRVLRGVKDNPEMAIAIPGRLTDDNDFLETLNSMLKGLAAEHASEEIWVIQIDNWFDHKWLRFSGNGIVASSFPADYSSSFMDRFASVKREFRLDKLTFPPFTPQRILGQWSFLRSGDSYVEWPLPKTPHGTERRRSAANLHERAQDFSNTASFVWFSGNTLKNGRGSIMVYNLRPSKPVCWFAAFARKPQWTLERTKGIDKEQVARLLASE